MGQGFWCAGHFMSRDTAPRKPLKLIVVTAIELPEPSSTLNWRRKSFEMRFSQDPGSNVPNWLRAFPVGAWLRCRLTSVDVPPTGDYIVVGLAAGAISQRAACGYVSSGAP
jgi:hypothetical protein